MISQADLNLHSQYVNQSPVVSVNVLSVDGEVNDIGYAGYVWNDETAQWYVRNRVLSPKLGRWLERVGCFNSVLFALGISERRRCLVLGECYQVYDGS